MDNNELLEAKKELYHLLLVKERHEMTDIEINILYYLSLDDDIQEFLSKKLSRSKEI